MLTRQLPFFILIALISLGCSANKKKEAVVSGKFSVTDTSVQDTLYLPVDITIVQEDSVGANPDTLFQATTDSSGSFSGTASFASKREYPAFISRDGRNLLRFGVILAEGDSVQIEGRFPGIGNTLTLSSREHDALRQFRNLNRGFQRVARFISAGQLQGDTLEQELSKWSDLYYELYKENEQTRAGELAITESIRLLQGWDNSTMMKRIRSVQKQDNLVHLAANYGKDYVAESQGLEAALAYLDSLEQISEARRPKMQISIERIGLLYDSARVEEAQHKLEDFKKQFDDDSTAQKWAESISYDLNYLSPGDQLPEFEFTQKGAIISRDSLLGEPYILEITRLANPLYQEQFDRTVVIHSIYKNYGLNVVTLPLDESQITVDAFFEERIKPWPVADARAFDRENLLEKFNIRLIPTRFLIDRDGKIVRKYVGREFQDIIQDLQSITN
ncbi:TlpA family protein disulfide reductase [Fodinibius sediminis]|uniref:Uncharacterized protein n=1 Tax=Fodinibius sediminis TaxID=1214077 RepID=A0A521DAD2_9BACT|nr:thioredoxin-like domain-containing protein [Fodinibius sediminis]SMO68669.1 hypothetical protein SAMN06265218_10988 [Fodinibius sediminis]